MKQDGQIISVISRLSTRLVGPQKSDKKSVCKCSLANPFRSSLHTSPHLSNGSCRVYSRKQRGDGETISQSAFPTVINGGLFFTIFLVNIHTWKTNAQGKKPDRIPRHCAADRASSLPPPVSIVSQKSRGKAREKNECEQGPRGSKFKPVKNDGWHSLIPFRAAWAAALSFSRLSRLSRRRFSVTKSRKLCSPASHTASLNVIEISQGTKILRKVSPRRPIQVYHDAFTLKVLQSSHIVSTGYPIITDASRSHFQIFPVRSQSKMYTWNPPSWNHPS